MSCANRWKVTHAKSRHCLWPSVIKRMAWQYTLLLPSAVLTVGGCSTSVQPREDATSDTVLDEPNRSDSAADTSTASDHTITDTTSHCNEPWFVNAQGQCVCAVECSLDHYCCNELVGGNELQITCRASVNGGPPATNRLTVCGLP